MRNKQTNKQPTCFGTTRSDWLPAGNQFGPASQPSFHHSVGELAGPPARGATWAGQARSKGRQRSPPASTRGGLVRGRPQCIDPGEADSGAQLAGRAFRCVSGALFASARANLLSRRRPKLEPDRAAQLDCGRQGAFVIIAFPFACFGGIIY